MKRKYAIVLVAMLGLAGMSYANCGNDNGNGNGCSGNEGPAGPIGATGPQGTDGQAGANGKDGRNGTDAQVDNHAKLVLDTAIRLYDGKRVQVQAFNVYQPSRVSGQDVLGDGKNFMFGARIVLKLGSSYEERLLQAQKAQIEALQAAVARLSE